VARVGGRVVRRSRLWSGREATEIVVPHHRARLSLLASLARWDARRPRVIELARSLAGRAGGSDEHIARALHRYIRELFRSTERTLVERYGDCDDSARALLALCLAAGLRAGLATTGTPPRHVAVVVRVGARWLWAEPTIRDAQLGEHPLSAVRRAMRDRPDLARDDLGQIDPAAEIRELRAGIATIGALAMLATGARAAWDRRWPTPEELALALTTGAWSPVVATVLRRAWDRWTREPQP